MVQWPDPEDAAPMNTKPLTVSLAATGLVAAGAFFGILGAKMFAPQWLAPASLQAAGSAPQAIVIQPTTAPTTRPVAAPKKTVSAPSAPKVNPFDRSVAEQTAAARDRDATRARAMLTALRSQLELYRLQHNDQAPLFAKYPAWHPLTRATRADGTIDPKGDLGPYLNGAPANPLNGFVSIGLTRQDPKPGQVMKGDKLGWIYCVSTHRLFATEKDGKTILGDH